LVGTTHRLERVERELAVVLDILAAHRCVAGVLVVKERLVAGLDAFTPEPGSFTCEGVWLPQAGGWCNQPGERREVDEAHEGYASTVMRVALAVAVAALVAACGVSDEPASGGSTKNDASVSPSQVPTPFAPKPAALTEAKEPAPNVLAFIPATPSDYLGKHVLIPHGATLRVAPTESADAAVLHWVSSATPRDAGPDERPLAVTMEVVGVDGEYLAVRGALDHHRCTAVMPALSDFDIKLWVKPSALAPVLAVRTEIRGGEGDGATLWPGVPVRSDGINAVIDAGGLELSAPLDAALISSAFEPEPRPVLPGEIVALEAGPAVTWSGTALDESVLARVRRNGEVAAILEDVGGARPITVWTRCARVSGKVVESRPTRPPAHDAGEPDFPDLGPIVAVAGDAWEIAGSSTVFARGGAKIGVTIASTRLSVPPRSRKGRSCFDVALAGPQGKAPANANLELCFDDTAVTEIRDPLRDTTILRVLGTYAAAPSSSLVLGSLSGSGALDSLFDSSSGLDAGIGTVSGEIGGVGVLGSSRVLVKKVTVSEGANARAAKLVVGRHRVAVRGCYDDLLKTKEGASGALKLHLKVAASGRITGISTSDDSVTGDVAACIEEAAKVWRFASTTGPSSVVVRFVFSSM